MVVLQPGFGYDITPPATGFFSIVAKSVDTSGPFSIRSYTCGTSTFVDMLLGNYMNVPYYVGSGNCLQLYNPSNSSVEVNWKVTTDSPATALVSVSLVIWFLLLFFSYLLILGGMVYGTTILRRIYREKPLSNSNQMKEEIINIHQSSSPKIDISPQDTDHNQPSAPTMMYLSSFNKDVQISNQGH